MKRKTVLVLPPDERIQTVNGRVVFRYPNGNGGHVSVDSGAPHFPLICIGLWTLIIDDAAVHSGYGYLKKWAELANDEIKLEDCRFRKMTAKELKEIGV